jgi:large subunit ribosomal protein L21
MFPIFDSQRKRHHFHADAGGAWRLSKHRRLVPRKGFSFIYSTGLGEENKIKVKVDIQPMFWWNSQLFFESKTMYAIIETGGKQYRVSAGDTIEVERIPAEAGQTFTFDRVLFCKNEGKTTIGSPAIKQAGVVADVVKHIRGVKTVAFKMKRRKGYHHKVGHRQELTVVKIKEIKA